MVLKLNLAKSTHYNF